ncbi:MAG: glycoside hydrolase family 88 protein [Clostridia bacterium]|nr:glycoside hydrolase family 88 protein [Clostridia bacterium]
MRNAEWMSGKYGIMVHFLSKIGGVGGEKKLSPNEMAEKFDVKAFADEIEKMGASWIIFPFGQNTGYYWSENPYIEEKIPGRCTRRDLIVEIADEVTARGIRFIAYLPTEMDFQEEDMRKAFAWNESSGKEHFMENWMSVIRYYSNKLGDKLSGWWYDGCYNSVEKSFTNTKDWSNSRFDKEKWFEASRAGNPNAVIAMCTGANLMQYVFEDEDYLPGESNDLIHYPWNYESKDKQWHVLTWLDCFWMLEKGQQMPDPRFSNKVLYDYVRKCTDKKGAVTLNIGIFEDGTLSRKTVKQVEGLKKVLKIKDYTLLTNRYNDAISKFPLHMKNMHDCVPFGLGSSEDGNFSDGGADIYELNNWTTSFVTGLAPLYYETVKNDEYIRWANSFKKHYRTKVFEKYMDTMHDLGFLYSPYSVAMYKLTGDDEHRETALKAADELAKRFVVKGNYIDAWERMTDTGREGRAIIDSMMNIPLILWAWKETGHTYYRDIAISHAETVEKLFIRDDFSTAHSFTFNKDTGKVIKESNACGYCNGSWWARGAAWAIYGFAILAKYTGSEKYRQLSSNIAKAYISQLNDDSIVPVWDFRLPSDLPAKCNSKSAEWDESDIKNCEFNVDTSAASVTASGILCLYEQTGEKWMLDFALKSLEELGNKYVHWQNDTMGILTHQNGQMVYTTFGDYFYVEALSKVLYNTEGCW